MKSSDNLSPRRKHMWDFVRLCIPGRMRWFYEGHPKLRGQLWYAERKLLYETIRAYRPVHCFEIGTWRGGGSTLFISQALHDNQQGMLHTVEVNKEFYNDAMRNYETNLPELVDYVAFHLGDYKTIYGQVLEECKQVDFLILDGAEHGEQTLDQYNFFAPYLRQGSLLMAHDWFTEKCELLRREIEGSKQWGIVSVLTPPKSVGLALAVRNSE